MRALAFFPALVAACALASCCKTGGGAADPAATHSPEGRRSAIAVLRATGGGAVKGVFRFAETDAGVRITAEVAGLTPNAQHAFHIHEWGDATSGDGKSAGGHFNPAGAPHGLPATAERHAGDFGNLQADGQGRAAFDFTDARGLISIAGGRNPILGRSVIVHAAPDDGGQPTGNAGGRIAQAIIGLAKP